MTSVAPASRARVRVALLFAILSPLPTLAASWQFGGHAKYQYTYTDFRDDNIEAQFGDNPAQDQSGELRLKTDGREGAWDFSAHVEVLAVVGDTVETQRALGDIGVAPIYGRLLPNDDRQLWDLTHTITDTGRRIAEDRLDRLSVGYSTARTVTRFGRQAVSWGNGLVFQVLDFVNPFSPVAINKDYKEGQDMLYAQASFTAHSDLQAMIVPRRNPANGELESSQYSYAGKLRHRLGGWDVDVLLARHYGEDIFGLGFTRGLGGAVWRLDASLTNLNEGDAALSLVTNLDYSWTWGGKNVYGYVEYFRSGVGYASKTDYTKPNPELLERIQRGELFTIARDYAGIGLQVELTPLFNLFNNLIVNIDDGSLFYQIRGVYDWQQNLELMVGFNIPAGDRGEEFGGIPTPIPGAYIAPGRTGYAQLAWYF